MAAIAVAAVVADAAAAAAVTLLAVVLKLHNTAPGNSLIRWHDHQRVIMSIESDTETEELKKNWTLMLKNSIEN